MAELISDEEKSGTKGNSLITKILHSPARTNSSKKSSNPLSKLLLRRKSKRRGEEEEDAGSSSARSVDSEPPIEEEDETPNLTEEVKQVVEKQDISSETTNESKVAKFKEEVVKAEENFTKEYTKAEEEWQQTLMHKDPKEEPSNIAQRVLQEVVDVETKIDSKEEEGSTSCCQEEEECKVKKKEEDNCVSTLALWLQKVCAPWSLKKDD
ncbi:hypothetical protein RND81_08G024500 [Saponaria officinalis]|uniref:Uncharacterized protein n=1 Tax=Saponaria officinalis TaxID=3572 RepID=A0AAW1J2Y1_SAPOF